MKPELFVTKASGALEPFSIKKLKLSLERARATPEEIDNILGKLTPGLYHGISTKKIYSEAFRLLRQKSKSGAARYNLKKAIMELGPSGFPFEKYIGKILEHQGFNVTVDKVLSGQCVSHEIDVIATRKDELVLVECKYRNKAGIPVDVKTPLYIHSRFEDVRAGGSFKDHPGPVNGWIVTNSKFTSDAIAFGKCKNLYLLSWDYPLNNSLRDLIDRSGLYPLTCINSLTIQEKQWLLAKGVVLVRDVYQNEGLLSGAGVSAKRFPVISEEGSKLLITDT